MDHPIQISHQLGQWLSRVESDNSIPQGIRLDMGLFLDRVVELVEQTFREILRLSIKLKFMPDSDLSPQEVRTYRQQAERLQARDHYRDVDFICGRLHVLRTEFEAYRDFTRAFGGEFQQLMWLIDEREGALMSLVQRFMHAVAESLVRIESAENKIEARRLRDEMVEMITEPLTELENAVAELVQIHNRILPMLGESEFLKIISKSGSQKQAVQIVDKSVHTGGGDYAKRDVRKAGRDYVEQRARQNIAGRDLHGGKENDAASLDAARRTLHEAVLSFPEERRELIQKQIDKVVDGITRKSKASALQESAAHLDMFLESGKELLSDGAKAAWEYVKGWIPGKKSK